MIRTLKISAFALLAAAALMPVAACSGKKEGQSGKNAPVGKNALYKKADAPIADRVEDLLKRMTLEEKIGQMTQLEKGSAPIGTVRDLALGSVLSGGGGSPASNTAKGWADMVDSFQDEALATRLAIPIIYGVDAVHGHNNLKGATIFPHDIALGAAGDADLVRRIGEAAATEAAATGILWDFGPCVAVARDPRWGRTYESFGEDSALVTKLGTAFIEGYQGAKTGTQARTAACAKHFLGDGGTVWGSSKSGDYQIDQGDTRVDEAYLRGVLLPPYEAAIKGGVRTVMVSFSSMNGVKMHARKDLVTDLLKGELGFTGFVVSDWGGMDQINPDYHTAIVAGINAGVDMNMVPYDGVRFIQTVKKAVENKEISMDRIDDAVRRILRVKLEMGLFEAPKANRALASEIRSPAHLALAREAVAKSQVVLKNEGALPIAKGAKKIYVAGNAADDIGLQCGGWTMTWQGSSGAITAGTSILAAIKEKNPDAEVVYSKDASFEGVDRNAACVVVLGEKPYAEGVGDSETLSLGALASETFARARAKFSRVTLVIVSGRPVVLDSGELKADAIVAAWLPGTEGAGVADVLFGDAKPAGKLSFAWPRSVSQLPLDRFISGAEKPLWPAGHGLSY